MFLCHGFEAIIFSKKNLSDLSTKYRDVEEKTNNLLLKYVAYQFKDARAKEYATQWICASYRDLTPHSAIYYIIPPRHIKVR